MSFTVIYHPAVKEDVAALSKDVRDRIKSAIATRLTSEPDKYGKPLRGTLAGYWKLRVGDWRVVYAVRDKEVVVFAIKHRRACMKRWDSAYNVAPVHNAPTQILPSFGQSGHSLSRLLDHPIPPLRHVNRRVTISVA